MTLLGAGFAALDFFPWTVRHWIVVSWPIAIVLVQEGPQILGGFVLPGAVFKTGAIMGSGLLTGAAVLTRFIRHGRIPFR